MPQVIEQKKLDRIAFWSGLLGLSGIAALFLALQELKEKSAIWLDMLFASMVVSNLMDMIVSGVELFQWNDEANQKKHSTAEWWWTFLKFLVASFSFFALGTLAIGLALGTIAAASTYLFPVLAISSAVKGIYHGTKAIYHWCKSPEKSTDFHPVETGDTQTIGENQEALGLPSSPHFSASSPENSPEQRSQQSGINHPKEAKTHGKKAFWHFVVVSTIIFAAIFPVSIPVAMGAMGGVITTAALGGLLLTFYLSYKLTCELIDKGISCYEKRKGARVPEISLDVQDTRSHGYSFFDNHQQTEEDDVTATHPQTISADSPSEVDQLAATSSPKQPPHSPAQLVAQQREKLQESESDIPPSIVYNTSLRI